jgi:hypothetical protein
MPLNEFKRLVKISGILNPNMMRGRKGLGMSVERGRKKSGRGKEAGGKREGKSVRE